MFVVHGTWVDRQLAIWAEDTELPHSTPSRARTRRHPFAADPGRIAELLATTGTATETTLLLPGSAGGPQPSTEPAPRTARLLPWRVPALLVPADPAGPLLSAAACADDAGWTAAPSLRYLAVVAEHADDLARRGRVLPQLDTEGGQHAARWRPVLTGADGPLWRDLAAAMPPVCRAATPAGSTAGRPATDVLREALNGLVDAAVRRRLPERLLLGHRPGPRAPLADRWAVALTAADPTLPGADPAEARQLTGQLTDWLAAAHEANQPVQVCFRLIEPPPGSDDWQLEFALQSTEDPSLYVPAELLWSGQRLPGLPPRPDELLLAGLGRAVRLFPDLHDALLDAHPGTLALDTGSAVTFLRQAAPLLQAAGYGVRLPAWAGRKAIGLKLTTRSASPAGSSPGAVAADGFGLQQLVDFRIDLAIGDQTVDVDDLAELARLKVPLVRLRGQWVELDERQLKAAITMLSRPRDGQLTVAEVLHEVAEGGADDLPLVEVDADGLLGDLLSGEADQRLTPVPTPADFVGTLRPYQERGLSWLSFLSRLGLGGILADDMGLGKCISPESAVAVEGTLMAAQEVWDRYATDVSSDGEGEWATPAERLRTSAMDHTGRMVPAEIARLYRQPVRERLRRIRLDDGSEAVITLRHRLLGPDGWTAEVAVGDRVCVPRRLMWDGEAVDPDLVRLLAWQISEGHEDRKASLRITQKNSAVLHDLVARIHAMGVRHGRVVNQPRVHASRGVSVLQMCSVDYAAFLAEEGYRWGRRSAEKRIPDFIMAADQETIRLFLREYFTAEGSVGTSQRVVEIASASPWLMRQLGVLLRRLGIWLRTVEKWTHATNGTGIRRPYQIGIVGGLSLRIFRDLVGFSDPVKQAKLDTVCAKVADGNVDAVPAHDLLDAAQSLTALPQRHFGVGAVHFAGSQEMPRKVATDAVPAMTRMISGANRLATRAARDAYYARVVAVEDVFHDGYVYDFEVPEHHNYVAGGMLCHNTASTLSLLLHERGAGPTPPTLLICPMSLVSNWQKETARFAPALRVYVHHGAGRERDDDLTAAVADADLVITTYGTALRDLAALRELTWGRVVCDEAQAIKNSGTRQAQAVRAIPARTRLALTGTPVENHLAELWSIMEFCNPGLLGPAQRFRRRYQEPIELFGDEQATAALRRATGPFVLRRLKTDKSIISDLPEKLEMKVWCPLTAEQASLYAAVVEDMMAVIEGSDGIERRGNVIAAMTRLKQVCNHPAHLLKDGSRLAGRSGKLARLEELAAEIVAEGDKALVFTQYAEFGTMLQPYLAARLERPVLWLHGGLAKARRDELVDRFQTDDEPMIFLLSLKAAGTGLNLTAANHVIHVDRWWNPAVEDQATDRAFRIGQSRNVQVRKFICAGTLEERIDEMIERKKTLAQRVVGTGEDWIGDLSTDELRELFRLDPAAVS